MLDQAEKLRELANMPSTPINVDVLNEVKAKIITVTSGKGGVGKSNFVVNLAITLQKSGKRVMIFDADVGMGNDDVLMGFLPKYNVYDVIFDNKDIEDVVIEGPYGIKLLPGGSGITQIEQLTDQQRNLFIDKLSKLENLDFIIMDTGAGISRSVLGFVSCCEELIVITTPEPTSLTDAYSLLKMVTHFKIKSSAKVIVNRTLDSKEGISTFNKLNNAAANFLKLKLEYLGNISEDRKLVEAVRNQSPFVISAPNCIASQDVLAIANKILGLNNSHQGIGVKGLFKKIFNIFS